MDVVEASEDGNNPQLSLQKCISYLKSARSDNERFAALLLVTQLVNSNSLDSAGRRSLFHAVGFNFVNRLLNSNKVPEDCPQDVYRSLALTILACFVTDDEFLVHPEMLAKIPQFLAGFSDEEENVNIVNDCYQILSALTVTSVGCSHLGRKDVFTILSRIASCGANQAKSKKAIEIMVRVVNSSPFNLQEDESPAESIFETVRALSKRFKEAQDCSKFELCSSLVLLLASINKTVFQKFQEKQWLKDINIGVNQILQSKVSSQQRDPAVVLVSLVTELVGMDWMIEPNGQKSPGLFILSVTVASIETRMILDGKTWVEVSPKADLLISCYNILEKAINFVIVNTDITNDVQLPEFVSNNLPKVYSLATEAIHSIIQFLGNVISMEDKEITDVKLRELVYASVRVLCAWMAEETAALQDSICKLLPFLLKLGKESLDTFSENVVDAKSNTSEDQHASTSSSISTVNVRDVVGNRLNKVDIMRFLLPPLCHLSADDKTRKILIENGCLELLSKYFFQQWKIWNEKQDNDTKLHDSKTCLVTLLGIVLNIVVTEPKLVVSNHMLKQLAQHAILSTPLLLSTEANVVILVNQVVLGLLFIRSSVEHNDSFTCDGLWKFLQTSIQILKEAKPLVQNRGGQFVEQKKTQVAIRCKEAWSEISELWFLGLQVISVLVNSLPVVKELLEESGWMDMIINIHSYDQELTLEEKDALLDLGQKVNNF
ncbi:neurochondrin-like [Porites lutea]|uniref:neurochondrin-like n=1 Tax=Porites lutea TaxID=51062 RepID=UPI003CC5894A